eukprot:9000913-Karenia_brevis.AAC.1
MLCDSFSLENLVQWLVHRQTISRCCSILPVGCRLRRVRRIRALCMLSGWSAIFSQANVPRPGCANHYSLYAAGHGSYVQFMEQSTT